MCSISRRPGVTFERRHREGCDRELRSKGEMLEGSLDASVTARRGGIDFLFLGVVWFFEMEVV